MSGDEWAWDGKSFVHSLAYITEGCREIQLGGPRMLPTFVSEVKAYKDKENDSHNQ
ncbi:hypothetical protein [Citrobacter sp. RHB25-C09]|uniref:hypothetical protein n=1 Tax=Citrobacter sp. RHB25-C09 TaxID=2742624 RepID=UPI0031FEACFA